MFFWIILSAVLSPVLAHLPPRAETTAVLDVSLKTGTFRGVTTSNGTERWLGIPFAQQPVGKLRFKAPVAITERAEGIQDASAFGNACPQLPGSTVGAPIGEDCLVLNVRGRFAGIYFVNKTF